MRKGRGENKTRKNKAEHGMEARIIGMEEEKKEEKEKRRIRKRGKERKECKEGKRGK